MKILTSLLIFICTLGFCGHSTCHCDLSNIPLYDSSIIKVDETKVYLNPDKIHLSEEGFIVELDHGKISLSQLSHDNFGFFIEQSPATFSTKNVPHHQIQLTPDGMILEDEEGVSNFNILIFSNDGRYYTLTDNHECPPLMKLCSSCHFACNPFWAKKCHHCGKST